MVLGAATVISAMGGKGQKTSKAIDEYLKEK